MSEHVDKNPVLLPFGPTRPVPKGHRWCFSCDGTGVHSLTGEGLCRVCQGKGHWNLEDIERYQKDEGYNDG